MYDLCVYIIHIYICVTQYERSIIFYVVYTLNFHGLSLLYTHKWCYSLDAVVRFPG